MPLAGRKTGQHPILMAQALSGKKPGRGPEMPAPTSRVTRLLTIRICLEFRLECACNRPSSLGGIASRASLNITPRSRRGTRGASMLKTALRAGATLAAAVALLAISYPAPAAQAQAVPEPPVQVSVAAASSGTQAAGAVLISNQTTVRIDSADI